MPRAYSSADDPGATNWISRGYHGQNVRVYGENDSKTIPEYTTYTSTKKAYNFNNHMCHIVGDDYWKRLGAKAGFKTLSELLPAGGFKDLDGLFFDGTAGICAQNPGWIGSVANEKDKTFKYGFLIS